MPDDTRLPITPPTIPMGALDLFVESFLLRWDGTNTRAAYRQDVRNYIEWCTANGIHPIDDVRRPHLDLYMRYLREERHNGPSTISRRIGTLNQLFELAIDDGMIVRNPARMVRRPPVLVDQSERVSLTRDEMQRLTLAAHKSGPNDYALVVLMGYLGLRVSEACGLDVNDCLFIAKSHRCLKFAGKGNKPALIPQPPVVMRAIDRVIGDRVDGPLLRRRDGSRQTRRSADRVVKRCAKVASLGGRISPHTCRHTFIVNSIDAGVSLREVQLSARHADISTTIRIYDRGRANLDTHSAHTLAAYFGAVA